MVLIVFDTHDIGNTSVGSEWQYIDLVAVYYFIDRNDKDAYKIDT